jgi:hypothetical protein
VADPRRSSVGAPSEAEQVGGGGAGALDVAHGHVVGRGAEHRLPQQHQRELHREPLPVVGVQGQRGEDHPVDQVPQRALEHFDLAVPVPAGLLDQHPQAVGVGGGDHRVGQLREVRGAQLRHDQRDHPRPALPQVPRGDVHPVAERCQRRLDALAGLRTDVGVAVDHVGHRLGRDARRLRDVPHGDVARAAHRLSPALLHR